MCSRRGCWGNLGSICGRNGCSYVNYVCSMGRRRQSGDGVPKPNSIKDEGSRDGYAPCGRGGYNGGTRIGDGVGAVRYRMGIGGVAGPGGSYVRGRGEGVFRVLRERRSFPGVGSGSLCFFGREWHSRRVMGGRCCSGSTGRGSVRPCKYRRIGGKECLDPNFLGRDRGGERLWWRYSANGGGGTGDVGRPFDGCHAREFYGQCVVVFNGSAAAKRFSCPEWCGVNDVKGRGDVCAITHFQGGTREFRYLLPTPATGSIAGCTGHW